MGNPVLEVKSLKAWYGLTQALFDVSFQVEAGETLALSGPNGGGKTTTMRGILGLVRTAGHIAIDGEPIQDLSTAERVRRCGIAVVHEGRGLFPEMSVRDNLVVGLRRRDARRAPGIVELFPALDGRFAEKVANLSGGEQQMVALGRAILRRPRLLLLDEPSLGLAPIAIESVYAFLETIQRGGLTILIAEENATRARRLADRLCEIRTGVTRHPT